MFSTRPLVSKSSSPFINPLVTVPKAPITIVINVTFMFHSFFTSLARSRYLSFFSLFSILLCGQPGQLSQKFPSSLFFLAVNYYKVWSSGRNQVIHLYVKIPLELVSHSPGLCIYYLFGWLKFTFFSIPSGSLFTYYHIYPTPPLGQDMTRGQFLSGV